MEKLTQQQREFLIDLKAVLVKHQAEISNFEGEIIIEFPDSNNLWTGNYNITIDRLTYYLSK